MKILALSSSRSGDSAYLQPALPLVADLLGREKLQLGFIPFASVGSYYEYHEKVSIAFKGLPHHIHLLTEHNAPEMIEQCDGIMVGGGNTFKLLRDLYACDLIERIRMRVQSGMPYIGWSAGSNILGPTICTTNDMPIVEPPGFKALNIFPFQINPHYYNRPVEGFNGETRDERLQEFLTMHPAETILALPEGAALIQRDEKIIFRGPDGLRLTMKDGQMQREIITDGRVVE